MILRFVSRFVGEFNDEPVPCARIHRSKSETWVHHKNWGLPLCCHQWWQYVFCTGFKTTCQLVPRLPNQQPSPDRWGITLVRKSPFSGVMLYIYNNIYIYIYKLYIYIYYRRKFRSQTSDNMDRFYSILSMTGYHVCHGQIATCGGYLQQSLKSPMLNCWALGIWNPPQMRQLQWWSRAACSACWTVPESGWLRVTCGPFGKIGKPRGKPQLNRN